MADSRVGKVRQPSRRKPAATKGQPGPHTKGERRAVGPPTVDPVSAELNKLPRAYLERAFTKLAEENARLRREVLASSSLWQVAHQDPLTGLWNRRYADERLAEEVSRSKRESSYRFSVVVVDVDNLKRINDQVGHAAGDQALRWVAAFLREGLRLHDICARLGGDEFLLILPANGVKEALDFVARLNRRWRTAAERDPQAAAISVGTASFPTDATTLADLMAVADDAMYAHKQRRKPAEVGLLKPARPQVTRI
jgi:diguanylate cyclase (GGDEF)-like protein